MSTLNGQTHTGTITSISAKELLLKTATDTVTVPAEKLQAVSQEIDIKSNAVAKSAAAKYAAKTVAWLELTDGTRLPLQSYEAAKGEVSAVDTTGAAWKFPTKLVRSVRFGNLTDPNATLPADEAAGDRIGIRKSESVDFLEGAIGDVTKEAVQFQIEGETIPVNRSKVDSLIYYHRATEAEPVVGCLVEDISGARLSSKSVEITDGKLLVHLLSGQDVERPLDIVQKIDFSFGKLSYLSDLPFESVKWTPFFDLGKSSTAIAKFFEPRRDRGREQSTLRLAGKEYKRGLSLTSRTEVVFKVPAKAKRLKALAGIDDTVRPQGNVVLVISGDGKQLYKGQINGKDKPVDLDLDLSGVRRLTVLVDFGEDLDFGDHLNLCEARIVK
ncbi:MAG: NPCBM/NEW2 domain-containing protein [Planctomycetota bacterium]|nr:NPCBM/NEW2 domain-containing protein [Planctomycetota bacterium]